MNCHHQIMETLRSSARVSPTAEVLSATKAEALASRLAQAIERGQLPPGARLRSIRDCAAKEGLARNTVVEAYNRLVARGWAEARPGSGYYVRPLAHARSRPAPHVSEAVDVVSLLREQLEQHYEVRVGDGRLPAAWLKSAGPVRMAHLRSGKASESVANGYGSPWGYEPLRTTITRMLAERSIAADARQVLLTQGANHALDLIVRHLLQPGDAVLVDAPGYYPLFGKLRLAKAAMRGVPRQSDGPDMEALARLAQTVRPKVFFTQSLGHNPTGGALSLPKAHRLLQLAAQHDFLVVEDDAFADLMPATAPRLAALDQLERVVYVSSFSKTLAAGLRIGYVAASPAIAAALCDLKMLTLVATSDLVERTVCQMLASGQYRRHLAQLRTRLHEALPPALKALSQAGLRVAPPCPGSYYLWAELPAGTDELALAREAAQAGIFIAPGRVFHPQRDAAGQAPAMRVNIAYAADGLFQRFMRGQR